AERHVAAGAPPWLRWAAAGGLTGIATILAVILAVLRRPTAVAAALSLDAKFGLKERITTSLGLTAAERESSAGVALLADVEEHIGKLEVGSRYPFALR